MMTTDILLEFYSKEIVRTQLAKRKKLRKHKSVDKQYIFKQRQKRLKTFLVKNRIDKEKLLHLLDNLKHIESIRTQWFIFVVSLMVFGIVSFVLSFILSISLLQDKHKWVMLIYIIVLGPGFIALIREIYLLRTQKIKILRALMEDLFYSNKI